MLLNIDFVVIINPETIECYFVDHHRRTFKEIFIAKFVFKELNLGNALL